MGHMNILGIPFTSVEGAVEANVERALEIIERETHGERIDLVMLPELFTCGYCALNLAPYAEPAGGPTMQKFRARVETLGLWIGYGFAETCDAHRVFNSWALLGPKGQTHIYRKLHLHPSTQTALDERTFLSPGHALEPFSTDLGAIGVMLCYDGCFVEVPRALVLKGAQLILWPSRSGGYLASHTLPSVRALDNTVPIVQVEGGQKGKHMPLTAWSVVASAKGNVMVSQRDADTPFRARVDCGEGKRLRKSWGGGAHSLYLPRRPELYGVIAQT